MLIFKGTFVRFPKPGEVALSSRDGLVAVNGEKIVAVADVGDADYEDVKSLAKSGKIVRMSATEILMPGFIDAHIHAPQFAFAGTGLDLPLLDWLNTYTFPHESEFSDADYAARVYSGVVRRTLGSGTTTASYFGTIHVDGTLALVDTCENLGQRAHVGKVCMDSNSPDNYREDGPEASAEAADRFVQSARSRKLVTPSVIPRFAPSCSADLLSLLGALSTRERRVEDGRPLPVHTHLSENVAEVQWVRELFPKAESYVDVYKQAGLLHESTYFAHCCHCAPTERSMVATAQAGVVHCPTSNFMVGRALCDVRQWLDDGVTVGLGTDAAAGWSTTVQDAMRHAVVTSRLVAERDKSPRKALSWHEALYLASKGGADVLGEKETGTLEPGKFFDALVVETVLPSGPYDVYELKSMMDHLEMFFWNGDDRNVRDVYVSGKRVAGSRQKKGFKKFSLAAVTTGAFIAILFAIRQQRQ